MFNMFKPAYTPAELTAFMARIEALQSMLDRTMSNYRTSQQKQPDGTVQRDERYMQLWEQYMGNLVVANKVLQRMLEKVAK